MIPRSVIALALGLMPCALAATSVEAHHLSPDILHPPNPDAFERKAEPPQTEMRFRKTTFPPAIETTCIFNNSTNATITFTINIDRYIGDIQKLLAPDPAGTEVFDVDTTAYLWLSMFDVDTSVPLGQIAECDRVSINGHVLPDTCVKLYGLCSWEVGAMGFPLRWLNFPARPPEGGSPVPAANEVKIEIDVWNSGPAFCTALDWAAIDIRVPSPIVFAHGGFGSPSTWADVWSTYYDQDRGLPIAVTESPLPVGLAATTSELIKQKAIALKTLCGVPQVNVVAHSKGGVDARYLDANWSGNIDSIIELGTPNGGIPIIGVLKNATRVSVPVPFFAEGVNWLLGGGGLELSTEGMEAFNKDWPPIEATDYIGLAGGYDPQCSACPEGVLAGIAGDGDLFVPVESVLEIPFDNQNIALGWRGLADPDVRHTGLTTSLSLREALKPSIKVWGTSSSTTTVVAPGLLSLDADSVAVGSYVDCSVAIESSDPVSVAVFYPGGDVDLELRGPGGVVFDSVAASQSPLADQSDEAIVGGRMEVLTLTSPTVGEWTARVRGAALAQGGVNQRFTVLALGWDFPVRLESTISRSFGAPGDTILIQAAATENSNPILGASASCFIVNPAGSNQSITLLDNGLAGDLAASDGVYSGRYFLPSGVPGDYALDVKLVSGGGWPGAPFARHGLHTVRIASGGGQIGQPTQNLGVDQNGNFLFDVLRIRIPITVTRADTYRVSGRLQDATGKVHERSIERILAVGTTVVDLDFHGAPIYKTKHVGTMQLLSAALTEKSALSWLIVAERNLAYTTGSFVYALFEHDNVEVIGGYAIPRGAGPPYPHTHVEAKVAVDVAIPGNHTWAGRLCDALGREVSPMIYRAGLLDAGVDTLSLDFQAPCILRSGLDGPYHVTNFVVSGPGRTRVFEDVVQTGVLHSWEFGNIMGTIAHPDTTPVICPSGDAGMLSFDMTLKHNCRCTPTVEPLDVYAVRTDGVASTRVWDAVSPSDPAGDTLRAYTYERGWSQDVARFRASHISGMGPLRYDVFIDGRRVAESVLLAMASFDLDRRAIGSVDRFDSVNVRRQIPPSSCTPSATCVFADFNGSLTVTEADWSLFAPHFNGRHRGTERKLGIPNGGELYHPGVTYPSAWVEALGESARVTLSLVRDSQSGSAIVMKDQLDSGALNWSVPPTFLSAGTDYRMEVMHTAGVFGGDFRDVGTDRSDGTFTITPRAIGNLAAAAGKNSVVINWTEAGQGVGQAEEYEVRKLVGGTISDANWNTGTVLDVPPGPGPQGTLHCMEVNYLSQCTLHSFGIKTKDNELWSKVSNVAVVTTMCSGNQIPFCDGEGFAGGGGGGEEGAPQDLGTGEARSSAAAGLGENSLLWNAGTGDVRDVMKLVIGSSEPEYNLYLRTTSQRSVSVDHVALGVVDHAPHVVTIAGVESVYVGNVGPVSGIRDAAGAMDDDVPYISRGGDHLFVDLGPTRGRFALVVESKGWSAATTLDSVGIVVERQGQDSSWTTAAVVHPRREYDSFAVPALGSTRFRLTPLREYEIRAIGKLTVSEAVTPTPLTLTDARQTRIGVADGAVRGVDGSRASLAPGDSLSLKFGKTSVPDGKVRDFFLTVKGSHPIGSDESSTAPGTLAESARTWTFALGPARPNPTTGRVTFSYTLATETDARMRIYDVAGRLLKDLVDGPQSAGPHEVVWDGRTNAGQKVPAGVYFYRLEAGGWHSERKLIVITQ